MNLGFFLVLEQKLGMVCQVVENLPLIFLDKIQVSIKLSSANNCD